MQVNSGSRQSRAKGSQSTRTTGRRASSTAYSAARKPARDKKRAQKVIDFIERLIVPSGEGQGKPFRLDEFQKKFIRDIYEPVWPDTGLRVVRRAILSMGRKNGKALALDTLLPTPSGWTTMG